MSQVAALKIALPNHCANIESTALQNGHFELSINLDVYRGCAEQTLYYEKDNYGARISVNNRDDYITDFSGSNGNVAHGTTGPTYVDMSAYYNYTDNLTFTLEVINLTDEYERLFTTGDGTLDLMREYNHTGTNIFLGARYNL